MSKYRFWAIIIIAIAAGAGFFVWSPNFAKTPPSETQKPDSERKFQLGLDLSGGTQLIYKADVSEIRDENISEAMRSLRDTIERRVNLFGVSEPLVQVEEGGIFGGRREERLIVELPGVTDVEEAIKRIGETPILGFMLLNEESQTFEPTGLTGRQLERASIQFDQNFGGRPIVGLQFNNEGSELFAEVTRANVGRILGIFLDGELLQAPYIREEIEGGQAVITGDFTADEARTIVRDLNYGALPMPIELLSTQSIGATLGEKAINQSVKAGVYAFIAVSLFLLAWYRIEGLVAALALAIYTVLNLAIFKLIPVTLTAAGIAGFILSIGMAVDANILIFERTREEFKKGKNKSEALKEGFHRAWTSIRDSNLSSIITAVILYYFAATAIIKGFALIFFIGVLVSMFSAITASRTILFALSKGDNSKIVN